MRSAATHRVNAYRKRRSPRLWRLGLLLSSAGLTGLLIGCAGHSRTTRSTGLIAEADWPTRITAGLEQLATRLPRVLGHDQLDASDSGEAGRDTESAQAAVSVIRAVALGLGVVLELGPTGSDDTPPPEDETELAFVSFSPLARDGDRSDPESARLPAKITLRHVRDGVRWHLYESHRSPPRGLVVHLGGNKYVRRALRKRGWAVLSSSSTGRYLQRRESPQVFEIDGSDDLENVAARLATIFDDELADWPYSLEAVLEYIAVHRPDIPQEPLVVMGFSIGALGLPAVFARMPDRFEAAVVVAGGANLLEIAHRSRKANRGIELRWSGAEPTGNECERLYAAYLERVKLDPYHTAAALTEMPVLLYQARYDRVVPAATGESLYLRLGKPERLVFPVGHGQLLRVVMRLQAKRIVDWMEAALSGTPTRHDEASVKSLPPLAGAPVFPELNAAADFSGSACLARGER